jgi:hypothetical protein
MKKKAVAGWLMFFVFLMVPLLSLGQEASNANRVYARGRVILKDSTRYDAENIKFTAETLSFTDKKTGQPLTFPLPDVDYVSRIKSHTLEGALSGGGLMLLGGLLGVLQAEADPFLEARPNAGMIILGLTVGGAAVGALVGSALSSEKTVFQKGRFVVRLTVPLTFHGNPGGLGLSLVGFRVQF